MELEPGSGSDQLAAFRDALIQAAAAAQQSAALSNLVELVITMVILACGTKVILALTDRRHPGRRARRRAYIEWRRQQARDGHFLERLFFFYGWWLPGMTAAAELGVTLSDTSAEIRDRYRRRVRDTAGDTPRVRHPALAIGTVVVRARARERRAPGRRAAQRANGARSGTDPGGDDPEPPGARRAATPSGASA